MNLDIQSQFLEKVNAQCKYLLVPGRIADPNDPGTQIVNPALIAPLDADDAAAAARETATATLFSQLVDKRILRYLRAGYDDIANLKDIDALPALMIEMGSGEFSLDRLNVGGDLPPRESRSPTVLNTERKRVILTLRLALTELLPGELYKDGGLEVNLRQSRPGRAYQIGDQLRQVLDRSFFKNITQKLPQYSIRTEIEKTDITRAEVVESDAQDTVINFNFEAIYKQQITRD